MIFLEIENKNEWGVGILNKKLYIGMVGILSLMMVGCNKSLAKVNDVEITKEQYKKTKAVLSATNN